MIRTGPWAAILLLAGASAPGEEQDRKPEAAAADRHFSRQIRPILKARCLGCHGEDPKGRLKGKLDLRSRAPALKGGESGRSAIVPGEPAKSPLYVAVSRSDPDFKMPPKESERLTPDELEAIRTWIRDGAAWPVSRPGTIDCPPERPGTSGPSCRWRPKRSRRPPAPRTPSTPSSSGSCAMQASTPPRPPIDGR